MGCYRIEYHFGDVVECETGSDYEDVLGNALGYEVAPSRLQLMLVPPSSCVFLTNSFFMS